MSVNFNRARLKKAKTNQEFRANYFRFEYNYCYICSRRAGSFYYFCSPSTIDADRHGSGKPIYSHKRREYKSWKYNRKTQFK